MFWQREHARRVRACVRARGHGVDAAHRTAAIDRRRTTMILRFQRPCARARPRPSVRLYAPRAGGDPADRRSRRRRARARRPRRARSPSSWRAGCARRRAPSPQEMAAALGADRRHRHASRPRRTAISTCSSTAPRCSCSRSAPRPMTPRPARRCGRPSKIIVEHTAINPNKAAHIGHLRNAALGDTLVRLLRFRRRAGRSAELHRRHRRPGRRRRRRLPRPRAQDARRGARDRRLDALRLLLLGPLRPRHRVVRRPIAGAAQDPRRRRCTPSSTAATTPPRSAPSSPTASSAAT